MDRNSFPPRYRGSYRMTALGLPQDVVNDILKTLESIPVRTEALADQISMYRSAMHESNMALQKVNDQIDRLDRENRLPELEAVNLSVTILPTVFVTVSCHGATGLDHHVRRFSETLNENLRYSVTPLFGDYTGRRLNVSHSIYCG